LISFTFEFRERQISKTKIEPGSNAFLPNNVVPVETDKKSSKKVTKKATRRTFLKFSENITFRKKTKVKRII